MAVTIRGLPFRERLTFTGDIKCTRRMPYSESATYFIGLSDGTLLEGYYDEERIYRFGIKSEGAGEVVITNDGTHDVVEVNWEIEWVTITTVDATAWQSDEAEGEEELSPLPEGVEEIHQRRRETTH